MILINAESLVDRAIYRRCIPVFDVRSCSVEVRVTGYDVSPLDKYGE